jgi:predicted phage terminase large subunit-like protein
LLETAPDADKRARGRERGWWSMAGTRYDFSDVYGSIIDSEAAKAPEERSYTIQQQDAIVEGDLSDLSSCKTIWPARMPPQALKDIENDPLQGPSILASQYRMNPIPDKSGLVDSPKEIVWMPTDAMRKIYAYLSLHVTVDLAGMEPSTNKLADNDFTVICPHGFGHDGTLYVLPIMRGRYTPFEVIDLLFKLFHIHPRIMDIKVEKEAHARVLLPFLKREMAKRQRFLPITEIRRDNRTSKQQRIKGLQPWFRSGHIKFADNQPHKLAIINEIMRFPKYSHDDILDTLADAMQNREGGVTFEVEPMRKADWSRDITDVLAGRMDGETVNMPSALLGAVKIWGEDKQEENAVDYVTGW